MVGSVSSNGLNLRGVWESGELGKTRAGKLPALNSNKNNGRRKIKNNRGGFGMKRISFEVEDEDENWALEEASMIGDNVSSEDLA